MPPHTPRGDLRMDSSGSSRRSYFARARELAREMKNCTINLVLFTRFAFEGIGREKIKVEKVLFLIEFQTQTLMVDAG